MATEQLYFGYASTAKIRFKISNCYYDEKQPLVFLIKTKCLKFLVPRKATILTKKYVYIPKSIYLTVLNNYYAKRA